jgi:hypothetical protein
MGRLLGAIYPHVSGRWQDAEIWVSLTGASLASCSFEQVLNGANRALIETGQGWELLQFQSAELEGEDTYRLSGLLRGQQGTEDAMAAGATEGARILFLSGAEQRLSVADWERSLDLLWSAGKHPFQESTSWRSVYVHEAVALRPWSPAHLRNAWNGDDVELAWVRRARAGGDAWTAGEPPHEWPEAYRVEVRDGDVLRTWDVDGTAATYSADMQAEDFPAGGVAEIRVAQLGGDGQPGGWASVELAIPAP